MLGSAVREEMVRPSKPSDRGSIWLQPGHQLGWNTNSFSRKTSGCSLGAMKEEKDVTGEWSCFR